MSPDPSPPGGPDPLESPELLMINAMLEAPEGFSPEAYGVDYDMLAAYQKPWQFGVNHQLETGSPPPVSVFAHQFPTFEVIRGVNPTWAANRLRSAHRDRVMRREILNSLKLLNDGDITAAQESLRELSRPMDSHQISGLSAFDPTTVEEDDLKIAYGTPWAYLTRLLKGGVGLGEVALIAARFGHGKSWALPLFASAMAETGATCAVITLEMPKQQYIRRIHRTLARGDVGMHKRLTSPDKATRKAALASLQNIAGKIDVFDPGDVPGSIHTVRRLAQNYQYVLIDYLGLMRNADGVAAIKDWRVIAEISEDCKRIALETRSGIVAAVQLNRDKEIAGADDLGRNADILATMQLHGDTSWFWDVTKNRSGVIGRFYTAFEPDIANYAEITRESADERKRRDEMKKNA